MAPATRPIRQVAGRALVRRRPGVVRLKRWTLALGLLALVYLAWPYLALWRLSQAAADPDPQALAARVDLEAVRGELRRKLNKDSPSAIGTLSDPFLSWLDQGIQRLGTGALEELVTLAWVRGRLGAHAAPGQGFLPQVAYAFFDAPGGFAVRLGPARPGQVHLRMDLQGYRWVVTAVYY